MAREAFIEKRFKPDSLRTIAQANAIIADYQADGLILTLRQLYYRFVAGGMLENTQRNYKNLGSLLNDARMAGLVDWSAMEDRTRNVRQNGHWDSPRDIVEACAQQFRFDMWADQPSRVEVWIEKDALVGVIARICEDMDTPYFACRGYTSQSEQYAAGKRFERYKMNGQRAIVLHLGDHDPSGIDMSRDNYERLNLFCRAGHVKLKRLALNMSQIDQYDPPPNPAKDTDSRFGGYQEQFGDESWELDALDPHVIQDLIEVAINEYKDPDRWAAAEDRQADARARLQAIADNFDDIRL